MESKEAKEVVKESINDKGWPFLRYNSGGDKEYACPHGVGHGGVHGCDGCPCDIKSDVSMSEEKDAPAKEELKPPCPQCGGKVKPNQHNIGHMCTDCEMDLYDDYRSWWCYKEIAKAKELNEALYKSNTDLVSKNFALQDQLSAKEKELEKIESQFQRVLAGNLKMQKEIEQLTEQAKKKDWNGSIIQRQNKEISALESRIGELNKGYPCCTIHGQPACLGCSSDLSNSEAKVRELESRVKVLTEALEYIKRIPDIPDFDSSPIEQVDAMCDTAEKAIAEVKE